MSVLLIFKRLESHRSDEQKNTIYRVVWAGFSIRPYLLLKGPFFNSAVVEIPVFEPGKHIATIYGC
jgi:hypothetical protein